LIIDIPSNYNYYFRMSQNIYHVLCLHVTNILIHNLSMTKLPVSIFSATKRGVPNLDLFNINLFRVFYFITIMLFVSNTIPIDLSVIYFNNIKSVFYKLTVKGRNLELTSHRWLQLNISIFTTSMTTIIIQ
jgi:hypothetical protein